MAEESAPLPEMSASRRERETSRGLEKQLSEVEGGRKWLRRVLGLLIVGGAIGGAVLYQKKNAPPPPARYLTQAISEGDVTETVQSTGVVKPLTEVKVGAQVSGRVHKVYVDFNSVVKKGDLLAE